jgi:hypothetical protein
MGKQGVGRVAESLEAMMAVVTMEKVEAGIPMGSPSHFSR